MALTNSESCTIRLLDIRTRENAAVRRNRHVYLGLTIFQWQCIVPRLNKHVERNIRSLTVLWWWARGNRCVLVNNASIPVSHCEAKQAEAGHGEWRRARANRRPQQDGNDAQFRVYKHKVPVRAENFTTYCNCQNSHQNQWAFGISSDLYSGTLRRTRTSDVWFGNYDCRTSQLFFI